MATVNDGIAEIANCEKSVDGAARSSSAKVREGIGPRLRQMQKVSLKKFQPPPPMRLLYAALLFLLPLSATAAPGDTTFVQAHSGAQLSWYGNYDAPAAFPTGNTSYRRIILTFTLGKYVCPGNPQYCGDWDYTVHTLLMTPTGDTLELGRLITPYANASYPRTPWNWTQRYTFDVTDYAPLLKGGATIRILYSGYSGGFTASTRFTFIEGTPTRNVTGVRTLWNGSFDYGAAQSIDTRITAQNYTPPAGTATTDLKLIITGHGADGQGCAEFCSRNYLVRQGGNTVANRAIWRADCGSNHMYPQSGTWIYDRGGWCPGDQVERVSHTLPAAGASSVDVDFDPHTSTGGSQAVYTVWGGLVHYAGFNKTLDASLDDIVAPSNHEMHFRQNPTCDEAIVRVSNAGSTPITSVLFGFAVNGATEATWTWNGTLPPLRDTLIRLPRLGELRSVTGAANTFSVRIISVNGATDADATNNRLSTDFTAIQNWPSGLRVRLSTNNRAGENSWTIYNHQGTAVASRQGSAANTVYTDTVNLAPGMCYRLVVADAGCDGLSWWANPNAGNGSLEVLRLTGSVVPLSVRGYFGGDFGCGFTQYFSVAGPESVQDVPSESGASLQVSPNPAQGRVVVSLLGVAEPVAGTLTVLDVTGRTVAVQAISRAEEVLDASRWPAGAYLLRYTDGRGRQLTGRVTIAH